MSDLTLDRLKAWLADKANIHTYHEYKDDIMSGVITNGMPYTCIRYPFVTRNGYELSIQQSGTHYCNSENEVEMWRCPPSPLLMNYGNGEDPYSYVPLEVVAGYIDSLESLPPEETP